MTVSQYKIKQEMKSTVHASCTPAPYLYLFQILFLYLVAPYVESECLLHSSWMLCHSLFLFAGIRSNTISLLYALFLPFNVTIIIISEERKEKKMREGRETNLMNVSLCECLSLFVCVWVGRCGCVLLTVMVNWCCTPTLLSSGTANKIKTLV